MKKLRMLFVVVFIVFAAMNAGCGKEEVWTYDFTAITANVDDWIIEDFGGTWEIDPTKGLSTYDANFSSPKAFTGDFTMEAEFVLDVDYDNDVYFELYAADEAAWPPENFIYSWFEDIGWTENEEWYVQDIGGSFTYHDDETYVVEEIGDLAGLNRKGVTKWKLIKKGNSYEIWIGTNRIADFDSDYCRGDQYCFTYYATTSNGDGKVWLKNIKVTYSGSMVDTPTP